LLTSRRQSQAGSRHAACYLSNFRNEPQTPNRQAARGAPAPGKVLTNGLENFWSLLKRGLKGTYVSLEPFHLFRYLDGQAFRFNERKDCDQGRFMKAVEGIVGRRVPWNHLAGKGGEDLPQAVMG